MSVENSPRRSNRSGSVRCEGCRRAAAVIVVELDDLATSAYCWFCLAAVTQELAAQLAAASGG